MARIHVEYAKDCVHEILGLQRTVIQMILEVLKAPATRVKPGDVFFCILNMDHREEQKCFQCTLAAAESIFNELRKNYPGLVEELNRELSGDSPTAEAARELGVEHV